MALTCVISFLLDATTSSSEALTLRVRHCSVLWQSQEDSDTLKHRGLRAGGSQKVSRTSSASTKWGLVEAHVPTSGQVNVDSCVSASLLGKASLTLLEWWFLDAPHILGTWPRLEDSVIVMLRMGKGHH